MRNVLLFLSVVFFMTACGKKPLDVQDGYVLSQGDSIYYKTIGVGEPLLIIHGGPILDHTYMLDHFMSLAATHQLVFYDQRVCGKSQIDIPAERMTFDAFVQDIEQIRMHLGLEKISLLGHSWGGLLAMHYAIAQEDQLDKLILSNSMAPKAEWWDDENRVLAARYTTEDREKLDKLVSSGLLRSNQAGRYIEEMMMISFKSQFYDTTKMNLLRLNVPNNHALRSAVFMHLSKEMAAYDLEEALGEVEQEVLLITGGVEPSTELHLTDFTKLFDHATAKVLPESGHFPFIEQPSEYFDLIKKFLAK